MCSSLNTLSFPEGSNTDRPDASAVHLHDFQRFLLHEQQVREQQGAGTCGELPGQWRSFVAPATCLPLAICRQEAVAVSLSDAAWVSQTLE